MSINSAAIVAAAAALNVSISASMWLAALSCLPSMYDPAPLLPQPLLSTCYLPPTLCKCHSEYVARFVCVQIFENALRKAQRADQRVHSDAVCRCVHLFICLCVCKLSTALCFTA